ncbi:nitrite reductase [Desulfotalea psychrophila]|uniref:Related to nitrite reductase n=1 Tax=Desulfotalea psychrophila (strain LSv54 / DSM 12343) TaxID=177439 RepID=Q6AQU5_DESPS|nr:nitrite reductase [Desulfotalea psychrophila]CAG35278.1 related to nitrite reductase [Desulfotalea psychrophila LSv54]
MTNKTTVHLTIMLPAGRLPLDVMKTAQALAEQYKLEIFFTTAQNLRLLNVPENLVEEIKAPLLALGVTFKAPGGFPLPRICVGAPHCPGGNGATDKLSAKILDKFSKREKTKAKFKIAISACSTGCSNPRTTDIGIVMGPKGLTLYLGGKGGVSPQTGIRVLKDVSEETLLNAIETLVEFHDKKTEKKQRIAKLLDDPEFPFAQI